jgi:hypothetical protein
VPVATLYYLYEDKAHRTLWLTHRELVAQRSRHLDERRAVARAITSLPQSERGNAESQLKLISSVLEIEEKDLAAISEALEASVKAFRKRVRLDAEPMNQDLRFTFELSDIPGQHLFDKAMRDGMEEADVRKALGAAFPKMMAFFEATKSILTISPMPAMATAPVEASAAEDSAPAARIFYRPAYSAVLTTYGMVSVPEAGATAKPLLRFVKADVESVLNPAAPVLSLRFEPSDWAERKLSVSFDESGRLAKLEQSGKSEAAAMADAAAEAAKASTQFSSMMSTIAEVQATNRKLASDSTLREIERLENQKKLLELQRDLQKLQSGDAASTE